MSGDVWERLQLATRERLEQAGELLKQHGKTLPEVNLHYDLRGRSAGQMRCYTDGRMEIRYNLELAYLQPEDFLARTVPHEVAHLVTWVLYGKAVRPHGPEWQEVMRCFGVEDASRCHRYEVPQQSVRRQRRWTYRCAGREHQLTTTRHNRVQFDGQRYECRECGGRLRWVPGPPLTG